MCLAMKSKASAWILSMLALVAGSVGSPRMAKPWFCSGKRSVALDGWFAFTASNHAPPAEYSSGSPYR